MTRRQEAKAYVTFNHPQWSDPEQLGDDIQRIFDICHGCRLCFNLCPSFPTLFDAVDEKPDEVEGLTQAEIDDVERGCFQCKLCYPKCPYTPPHQFMLDFPMLMLRLKEDRLRREGGPSFMEKQMVQTDLLGKVGTTFTGAMNFANTNPTNRKIMGTVANIHPDKLLPYYASESFEKWFARTRPADKSKAGGAGEPTARVALFVTCSVNYNEIEIGKAAIEVLERSGVEVVVPPQRCCGMPRMDVADFEGCRDVMQHTIRTYKKYIDDGYTVVTPGPSCSLMLREEYPRLAEGKPYEDDVKALSAATQDLCEFLVALNAEGKLNTDFEHPQGKISYHFPCHLKTQNIGIRSRDLMKLIPYTTVEVVEHCSGHDGTWAMKTEHFDDSMKIAKKLTGRLERSEPEQIASDCALAGLNIRQAGDKRPLHPIQIIAKAYGIEGVVRESD